MQPLARSVKRIAVGAILVVGVLFSVLEPATTPAVDASKPECITRNGFTVCFEEPIIVDRTP